MTDKITLSSWSRRLRWYAWRVVMLIIVLALIAMAVFYLRERSALAHDREEFPPRGRLVDVGGHKMHIYCTGPRTEAPTIVLDSGMGGWSELWPYQQDTLAQRTRVCSYDRSGYGWSEAGSETRNVVVLARELRTLLHNSGERAPYVLVGASFGGLVARQYYHQFPRDVAGMVLLDPAHEDALRRLPTEYAATERVPVSISRRLRPWLARFGFERTTDNDGPPFIPASRHGALAAAARNPAHIYAQIAEEDAWPESDRLMHDVGAMDSLPLLVISATEGGSPALLAARQQLHRELAARSSNGVHRLVPGMSHAGYIMDEAHGRVVTDAILETVNRVSPRQNAR